MHDYLLTLLLQHNVVNYILQHSMSFKLMHAEVFWQVKNEQDCFYNVLRVFVDVCVLIHKVVYGGFFFKEFSSILFCLLRLSSFY